MQIYETIQNKATKTALFLRFCKNKRKSCNFHAYFYIKYTCMAKIFKLLKLQTHLAELLVF